MHILYQYSEKMFSTTDESHISHILVVSDNHSEKISFFCSKNDKEKIINGLFKSRLGSKFEESPCSFKEISIVTINGLEAIENVLDGLLENKLITNLFHKEIVDNFPTSIVGMKDLRSLVRLEKRCNGGGMVHSDLFRQ